jgi:hypothetical protein
MLSQLTTFVQVFDGQNYGIWSKAMHAFLMAQGLWGFTDGTNTEPYPPINPSPIPPLPSTATQAESDVHDVLEAQYKLDKAVYDKESPLHPALFAVWQKGNDMALGNLTLRLSPAIQQRLSPNFNTQETWEWIMQEFGSATIPSVYHDLREAITICINPAHHPGPQFEKMEAAFGHMSSTQIGKGSSARKLHVPRCHPSPHSDGSYSEQVGIPYPHSLPEYRDR